MFEAFYATDIMVDEQKVKIIKLRKIRKKEKIKTYGNHQLSSSLNSSFF